MAAVRNSLSGRRPAVALAVLAAAALGATIPFATPNADAAIAIVASLLVVAYGWFGRRDYVAPHILLPIIWFAAVAIAQIKVLDFETAWGPTMLTVVFAAPLAFSATAWLGNRGVIRPARLPLQRLDTRRLIIAACVLFVLGVVGTIMKTRLLGQIPILSDEIDANRSAGGIKIPFYVTFLTNCFTFGAWMMMLRAAELRQRGRSMLPSLLLVLVCLAGVSLGASRNLLLIALGVPVIFAYTVGWTRHIRGKRLAGVALALVLFMAVSSGLFFVRTGQHKESRFETYFYGTVVNNTAKPLRPLLPVYIGLATPLETLNRVTKTFPSPTLDTGVYSVPGVPPQLTAVLGPRANFYAVTGDLSAPYYFNVATFAGPLFADGQLLLVVIGALILGGAFGLSRAWLLTRPSYATLAVASYIAYVAAFLFYENLAGFYTLSVFWDMGVIAVALRYCAFRVPSPRVDAPSSRAVAH
jgi:oligosaccharide repeat unit polymerase